MKIVTTSAKGQVVIPKKERKQLGIKPGSKVIIEAVDDHIKIRPVPNDPIEFYCGIFRDGSSLTEALLRENSKDSLVQDKKNAKDIHKEVERGEG